eukprot:CCRYP_005317-RB/>CCRYP_005317-RB protein AED:0.06 eAED:0.06 QI:119/1/1/1/1/1/2/1147/501
MMPSSPKRAPLPTSVTIRNFFPPFAIPPTAEGTIPPAPGSSDSGSRIAFETEQKDDDALPSRITSTMASLSFWNNRCDHLRGMLMEIRLDIVLKRSNVECEEDAGSMDNDITTICTLPNQGGGAAHPRWDHLNEHIIQKQPCEDDEWEKDIYPLLFARFVMLDQKAKNNPSSSSHNNLLLGEVPIHPSHLRPLPFISDASAAFATIQMPHSLPPNAILIHYDDGCTRVLPSLYWLLVRKNVIDQRTDSLLTTQFNTEDGSARFNERAFDALGDRSEDKSSSPQDGKKNTESNSIYDDKVFDLLGEGTDLIRVNLSNGGCVHTDNQENSHNHVTADEDIENNSKSILSDHDSAINHEKEPTTKYQEGNTPENDASVIYNALACTSSSEKMSPRPSSAEWDELHISPRLPTEISPKEFSLTKKEIAELRQQLQQEEELLKREQIFMNQEAENLRWIIEQVQHLQRETTELMNDADTERYGIQGKRMSQNCVAIVFIYYLTEFL